MLILARSLLTTLLLTDNAEILYGPNAKILIVTDHDHKRFAAVIVDGTVMTSTTTRDFRTEELVLRELWQMLMDEGWQRHVCHRRRLYQGDLNVDVFIANDHCRQEGVVGFHGWQLNMAVVAVVGFDVEDIHTQTCRRVCGLYWG